jgi:pimeloyl-ACP methyl ester carboxylesterase
MDAAGCEQATIFAAGYTAMSGLVLAAEHPERVRSVVIVNGLRASGGRPTTSLAPTRAG